MAYVFRLKFVFCTAAFAAVFVFVTRLVVSGFVPVILLYAITFAVRSFSSLNVVFPVIAAQFKLERLNAMNALF